MINTSLFALFGRYKGDASLAGVLENIQRGTYKQFIDETREALASGDKELAAKLKKKLPAFTPQATYSGKRLDPHITRYNQLVVLDIDHVGERELERITPLATEAPLHRGVFPQSQRRRGETHRLRRHGRDRHAG